MSAYPQIGCISSISQGYPNCIASHYKQPRFLLILYFDKRFFPVHPIQDEPDNQQCGQLLYPFIPLAEPFGKATNQHVSNQGKIKQMCGYIHGYCIHANDDKGKGPLLETPNIYYHK